jgi:heme exporter protein C
MWWKIVLFVLMTWVIGAAFILPAPQQMIGEASRIFYFHVPQAWVAALAFVVSMVASVRYLWKKNPRDDDRAKTAAELGLLFCLLATITGSMFAKVTWGSYWNWDPRETSIFILLLIYGAYFALRSAVEGSEKKARLAAVYAIFAFLTVPFLMFIMPRVLPSLHPSDSVVTSSGQFSMSGQTAVVFFPSLVAFTLLFIWIYCLGLRIYTIQRKRMEEQDA